MHLADYGRSRMVIVYDDGTTVEVCSIHCAAGNIKQNRDKQVKSLMVADYATKELIDARSAVWVVGGRKEGVMTALPKWAFAKEADAQAFMKEHGGETAPFEQVMKEAEKETAAAGDNAEEHHGHAHGGHSMGPGADEV
jgi:nitrous oxide reductase accessory protein NosL